jgi:hypothetical protein
MNPNKSELYHFCPEWMLESIRIQGIAKGVVVVQDRQKPVFKAGYQWLTVNPAFDQSWDSMSTLPYDRTAVRIEVGIKKPSRLYKWTKSGRKIAGNEMYEVLSSFGDPENWYVYHGIIKPTWFKGIVFKNRELKRKK